MKIALSDLTFDNLADWPFPIKLGVSVIFGLSLLFAGYWFDTKAQFREIQRAKQNEIQLRSEFEAKQQLAANFDAYQEQLAMIEKNFSQMLRQLPAGTEVPALLESISETGVASGLTFEVFKPLPEVKEDFYAELPIEIKVIGKYHELAEFVSRVASLDRIVTIHDLKIERAKSSSQENVNAANDELSMTVLAKTYRYLDENEMES